MKQKVEHVQALALQDKYKPLEFLKGVSENSEFENTEFLRESILFVKEDFSPFNPDDVEDIIQGLKKRGEDILIRLMNRYSLRDISLTKEEAEAVIQKAKREAAGH